MRWKNDEKLAIKVPEIDIILGGKINIYLIEDIFSYRNLYLN